MGRVSECLSATVHDRTPSSPSPQSSVRMSGKDSESACSAETHFIISTQCINKVM